MLFWGGRIKLKMTILELDAWIVCFCFFFVLFVFNGGIMGREENFVLINFIHSSSRPQSLLISSDVTNLGLGTIESFPFFDHAANKMKLRVSTKVTKSVTGIHCK